MSQLSFIQSKVTALLTDEFATVIVDGPHQVTVDVGDEMLTVSFGQHDLSEPPKVFMDVSTDIVQDWACTPELLTWIARNGFDFMVGTLVPDVSEDGTTVSMSFRYRLLADQIYPDEVYVSTYAVAESATELREQLLTWRDTTPSAAAYGD